MHFRKAFIFIAFLLTGCASTQLSDAERNSLATISIAPIKEPNPPRVVVMRIGDPSIGTEYKDLSEMHHAIYKANKIDIGNIVYQEMAAKLKRKGRLKYIEKGGDLELRVKINNFWGFGPAGPFTINQKPRIQVQIHAYTKDNRKVFYSMGSISTLSDKIESTNPAKLVNNPQLIEQLYRRASREAIETALRKYYEL